MATKSNNIDEYIKGFPAETQQQLQAVRNCIRENAPGATELISYAMPAFRLNNLNLVYFAGFKNHIGVYPAPTSMEEFEKAFAPYKTGKGSIQFPLDKPMPLKLISRIVKFRIKENSARVKKRKT